MLCSIQARYRSSKCSPRPSLSHNSPANTNVSCICSTSLGVSVSAPWALAYAKCWVCSYSRPGRHEKAACAVSGQDSSFKSQILARYKSRKASTWKAERRVLFCEASNSCPRTAARIRQSQRVLLGGRGHLTHGRARQSKAQGFGMDARNTPSLVGQCGAGCGRCCFVQRQRRIR